MENQLKSLGLAMVGAVALTACSPDHVAIDAAGRKTADAMADTATAMKDAGGKLNRAAGELGKDAGDAAITASIKADLVKDPELSALKIEVDTNQGVVTLNGVAPNESAADRAGRIAIAVKGVNSVRNHVVARKG